MPFNKPSHRRVLGRGLENLFPSSVNAKKPHHSLSHLEKTPQAKSLKKPLVLGIEKIKPNSEQPRKVFDKEILKELAESIKKNGLIQPVIVKKTAEEKYEIVAGERRWRAACEAGLYEIPVRILEKDNPFLSLVENLQRENLNPIEIARAYEKLIKDQNLTQEQLAEHLGIPRASLANYLRILSLSSEVQHMILEKKLSFGIAKVLLQEKDLNNQNILAEYFVKHKIGVRDAQKLLDKKKKKTSNSSKINSKEKQSEKPWQKEALNKIRDLHGVGGSVRFKKKGGELCLRFFTEDKLRLIMNLLLRQDHQ